MNNEIKKIIKERYCNTWSVATAPNEDNETKYNAKLIEDFKYRKECLITVNGYLYRLKERNTFNEQEQWFTLVMLSKKQFETLISKVDKEIEEGKKLDYPGEKECELERLEAIKGEIISCNNLTLVS